MSKHQDKQEQCVLEITPFGEDRAGLVDTVALLLQAMDEGCRSYRNSTPVISVADVHTGTGEAVLEHTVDFTLKDVLVLAAITAAPVALRGATDVGKTAVAEAGLNALFGRHGKDWWRLEISRGITEEDLLNMNLKKLQEKESVTEALSAAPWLSFPGKLLDEINRAPAKLNNLLLHIVDGAGLHIGAGLHLPVGVPYRINGKKYQYSFTIATANGQSKAYEGTFAEDQALLRRLVVGVPMDHVVPSVWDTVRILIMRRPRITLPDPKSRTEAVLRVYESLFDTIPVSPLAYLFILYLTGLGNCIRTRNGKVRWSACASLCPECHLSKSHPHLYCGRVGGLSPGLMLWTQELALGIAAVRAARVLGRAREDCAAGRCEQLQALLGSASTGEALYAEFREQYTRDLAVQPEDVIGGYELAAPHHLQIDPQWLAKEPRFEGSPYYAIADVARNSLEMMMQCLRQNRDLFASLSSGAPLSTAEQTQLEDIVHAQNPAMLSVISAFRDEALDLRNLAVPRKAQVA